MTEGEGGGVEGLPTGKQLVMERTELPGAQWAWEQTRDYNFKADPMLYANVYFIQESPTITETVTIGQLILHHRDFARKDLEVFYKCECANINKY